MADYRNIPNAEVNPDAPVTSELAYAFRDNLIAVIEGSPSAPKVMEEALTTIVTATGRNWVMARYISAGLGGVGTFAMLSEGGTTARAAGYTAAGGGLLYANAGADTPTGSPSGTWMLCGRLNGATGSVGRVSVWQRIS